MMVSPMVGLAKLLQCSHGINTCQAYMAAEVPPGIRGRITAQIAGAQKWAIMSLGSCWSSAAA